MTPFQIGIVGKTILINKQTSINHNYKEKQVISMIQNDESELKQYVNNEQDCKQESMVSNSKLSKYQNIIQLQKIKKNTSFEMLSSNKKILIVNNDIDKEKLDMYVNLKNNNDNL